MTTCTIIVFMRSTFRNPIDATHESWRSPAKAPLTLAQVPHPFPRAAVPSPLYPTPVPRLPLHPPSRRQRYRADRQPRGVPRRRARPGLDGREEACGGLGWGASGDPSRDAGGRCGCGGWCRCRGRSKSGGGCGSWSGSEETVEIRWRCDGGKEADLPDGLVGVSAGAGGGGKALKGGGWGMEGV
jgi:hypothetical protein